MGKGSFGVGIGRCGGGGGSDVGVGGVDNGNHIRAGTCS